MPSNPKTTAYPPHLAAREAEEMAAIDAVFSDPVYLAEREAKCLDVCRICIQPDHCRSHEQCHYTKSWLVNPDGSPRTDMKDHP